MSPQRSDDKMQVPIVRQGGEESWMQIMFHPERYALLMYYEQEFQELQGYLLQEFGGVQACYVGGSDNRIYLPPKDRIIEVTDALETCDEDFGSNLEKVTIANRDNGGHRLAIDYVDSLTPCINLQVIPAGVYQVGALECRGNTSHIGMLIRLSDGLKLRFMAGHSGEDTIDWRASRAVER